MIGGYLAGIGLDRKVFSLQYYEERGIYKEYESEDG